MKSTGLLIIFLLSFSTLSFAQEGITQDEVSFAVIEHVPLYYGCNENDSNQDKKKCMSVKIQKHIASNFNVNLAKSENLPIGRQKIECFFTIDRDGSIVNVKTKASHSVLEAEAKRVINTIPKLKKPGFQKGEPVKVSFFIPLFFNVENTAKNSLTKKEQKAIDKAQKKLAKKLQKELKRLKKENKKI